MRGEDEVTQVDSYLGATTDLHPCDSGCCALLRGSGRSFQLELSMLLPSFTFFGWIVFLCLVAGRFIFRGSLFQIVLYMSPLYAWRVDFYWIYNPCSFCYVKIDF